MLKTKDLICPFSGSRNFRKVFEYTEKPEGETQFSFTNNRYYREVWQCVESKHYLSIHDMTTSDIYTSEYMSSTYTDENGIHKTFERIISLDPAKSDNAGRVKRINQFAESYLKSAGQRSILDVGSGLGVFPYGITQAGWKCTALDPDKRSVGHTRNVLGIESICGDFMDVRLNQTFDAITFNKVLEHVEDPVRMLARSKEFLNKDGFVYIELPDGEMAAGEGKLREEFSLDHIHIFSFVSTVLLAEKSGFIPVIVERLREPSTKFTLRAFLKLTNV